MLKVVEILHWLKQARYEGGVKSTLFGGRARLDFNLFTYDVNDAQLTAVGGQANFNQVINADKVTGSGFELDAQALLTDEFMLTASVGYTKTKIKDPNLAVAGCGAPCTVTDPPGAVAGSSNIDGNPLPQSPKWTISLIADWKKDLEAARGFELDMLLGGLTYAEASRELRVTERTAET